MKEYYCINRIIIRWLLLFCAFILSCSYSNAKDRVRYGKINRLKIVADLPDTTDYVSPDNPDLFLDLGRYHQELCLTWYLPIWITDKPRLVLIQKDSKEYYELTDELKDKILKENNLNEKDLLTLGLYTKYGGKIILIIILFLIVWAIFSKKEKKREDLEFFD